MHMPQAWQMPQAAFAGGGTQQGYAQQQPQQWQQGGQAPPVPQGGMTQQATPPQAQQGTGDQTADVLQRIEQTLSGLVGFARQNGYNG
jgi:hypothetical protein